MFDELPDLSWIQQGGFAGLPFRNRGDLSQPKLSPLPLLFLRERGRLAAGQFLKFCTDVPEIALQVLQHGTGLAVPLRTLVRRGG